MLGAHVEWQFGLYCNMCGRSCKDADPCRCCLRDAIQRVRALHAHTVDFPPDVDVDSYRRGMDDLFALVERALDGAE